jgi:ubiquinone/menaquinone biosynthesis C-methylase UbiE
MENNKFIPNAEFSLSETKPIEKKLLKLDKIENFISLVNIEGIHEVLTGLEDFSISVNIPHFAYDSTYSDLLESGGEELKINSEAMLKMRELFLGTTAIDLGAGRNGFASILAYKLGVAHYIAVEPIDYKLLFKNISSIRNGMMNDYKSENPKYYASKFKDGSRQAPPTISLIVEDALTFLKRINDNSVSVMAIGIDSTIIQDTDARLKIGKEVRRVLKKDSAFLQFHSDIPVEGLTEENFKLNSYSTIKLYQ